MTQQATARRRVHIGMRMAVVALGLTALGVGMTAGTSAAHNPTEAVDCAHVEFAFTQYTGPDGNNRVTVVVDGVTVVNQLFGTDYSGSYFWDSTKPHTWSISVDANLSTPGDTAFDFTHSGTVEACTTASSNPPADTSTTTSTAASTTTTAPRGVSTTTATTAPTAVSSTTTATTAPTAVSSTTSTTVATGGSTTPSTVPGPGVAVGAPSPGSPAAPLAAPQGSTLPVTGNNTGVQLTLALAIVIAGIGLVLTTRRRARNGGA